MTFLTRCFAVIFVLSMLMLVTLPAPPSVKQKPPRPPPPVPLSVAGYRMVLFWPPGICYLAGEDCDKAKVSNQAFTAHGLWPFNTNWNSKKPKMGTWGWKSHFTPIPAEMSQELVRYWKSYNKSDGGDIQRVWKHQWDKHGENGHFSQDEYFETGLQLTKQYGKRLVQILGEAGIEPVDIVGGGYKVADIEAVLYDGLGKKMPEIMCKKGQFPDFYVLSEIRLLLDVSATQLLDAKSRECKEKVIYFLKEKFVRV